MPQANSTTSCPREISPSASESTLPCSAVMSAASSSLRALSSSRNAKSTWVRRASDVRPHAGGRLLRGRDDALGVGPRGQGDPARHAAGGGVGDVGPQVGLTGERRSVGPVRDRGAHVSPWKWWWNGVLGAHLEDPGRTRASSRTPNF